MVLYVYKFFYFIELSLLLASYFTKFHISNQLQKTLTWQTNHADKRILNAASGV